MDKLNVLIAGSTGYIGTQLVKLLCKHKNVKIKYLCGNTSVGKNISSYDKDLKKFTSSEGEIAVPYTVWSYSAGAGKEIIDRVLSIKFEPAKQNGRPVRVKYSLPILFK